jgi:phosphoribosylformimino-5-aminoimidazole carboxamide ribotide isomerase
MLIPSIDLMGGRIVQLVQGERPALDFDDFEYWIDRFSGYPLVQLIDLDAAKRTGDNRALIAQIVKRLPCQVGGGIRSVDDVLALLEAGAIRVILGSSLFGNSDRGESLIRHSFAAQLSARVGLDPLVFSVDAKEGRVAVRGWQDQISLQPAEAIRQLDPYCGAFLYTHIDGEGMMAGFPLEVARVLRQETTRQLIVAGGIRSQDEIDVLDAMGVDAVAGMAIYTGAMPA